MKKFFSEFKAFAIKGNVVNLAVGVMVGAAFQGVVTSLTENILSPIIGLFTGQNFNGLVFHFLGVDIKYGAFISSVINFFILAFVVFLLVRMMNRLENLTTPKVESPVKEAPSQRSCPYCLTLIPMEATRCPACTSVLDKV